MTPYARLTGDAWFVLPTIGKIKHEDGEHMLATATEFRPLLGDVTVAAGLGPWSIPTSR